LPSRESFGEVHEVLAPMNFTTSIIISTSMESLDLSNSSSNHRFVNPFVETKQSNTTYVIELLE
jgi:hypothetical protein